MAVETVIFPGKVFPCYSNACLLSNLHIMNKITGEKWLVESKHL